MYNKILGICSIVLFFYSCDNINSGNKTKSINSKELNSNENKSDTTIYFKSETNCMEQFDSNCNKSNIKVKDLKRQHLIGLNYYNLSLKDLIEFSGKLRIDYVKKSNNERVYNKYIDLQSYNLYDETLISQEVNNFCNYHRVYFNNDNEIGFIKLFSNNIEKPSLKLYPFFFKNYNYIFCKEYFYKNFEKTNKDIIYSSENADSYFIFIDKINKIKLCFGVEYSKIGYSNPNPIFWPNLFILDDNLYPIYYIGFRFDDRAKGAIDIENLYKLIYLRNTKYVKKYQELDFSSLNKTIIYSDSTKYQELVGFVKLLLEKGADLPNKKNGDENYRITFDTRFFPPVPEWVK